MPIGCEMNYVIFRKDRLKKVEALLRSSRDEEAAEIASNLLQSEITDDYLVAIESMVPFSEMDFDCWQNRLGLIRNNGYKSIDFYIPDIEVPICEWLEFSVLREKTGKEGTVGSIIWDGYRFVGDKSLSVCVGHTPEFPKKLPQEFPEIGQKINMSSYEHFNWEYAEKQGFKMPSWIKALQVNK